MDAEAGGGGAAARALGPLFRVTEVFLWDDAPVGISKSSTCHDGSAGEDSAVCSTSKFSSLSVESDGTAHKKGSADEGFALDDASVEDLELAQQMDALGLPTSFKTNKEQRRNTSYGEERKGILTESKVSGVQVPEVSRLGGVGDIVSSQVSDDGRNMSLNCITIQAKNDLSQFDSIGSFNKAVFHSDDEPNHQDVGMVEETIKEQYCTKIVDLVAADSMVCDCGPSRINGDRSTEPGVNPVDFRSINFPENAVENVGSPCYVDEKLSCELERERNLEDTSNLCCLTKPEETSIDNKFSKCFSDGSGIEKGREWGVFWDSFYMRNYYYNFCTQESTWYPPSGLEQSALSVTSSELNTDVTEKSTHLAFAWDENKHQCVLKITTLFQEVQSDGEVSGLTFKEVMSRDNYTTENSISDANQSFLGSSYKNLKEHVEQINCYETSASAEDSCAVLLCPADTMDLVERLASESNNTNVEEKWGNVSQQAEMMSMSDDLHCYHVVNHKKKKKVKRVRSNQMMLSGQNEDNYPGAIGGLSAHLVKYWYQRYLLFSKFDDGVKMDEEGWFSVTPEAIARHHASRCGNGTVIDCFTGVGGNAIQFAIKNNHVIAIDIDPRKVDYAQHNATIYGVGSNIDFIKGDFFVLASYLKADTVFIAPPWGGPDYAKVQTYDIRSMLKPHDGYFLFKIAIKIALTVVMFLPRNVDPNQLAELSLLAHPPWELEVEKNYLNGRLKGITAYFCHPSNIRQDASSDSDL
uniref:Trimethylguanosine synthase n=1 Tax=Anthurium amnicola TaxID=1678845 RepID=A0A1D1ZKW3_9ARAE